MATIMQLDQHIVEGVLGPHEVGVLFALFLFGMVTLQAFNYYQRYSHDIMGIKLLVSTLSPCISTCDVYSVRR
jgi:hypothetical protein